MDNFKIATETSYQGDEISSQVVYSYDEQGNLTQKSDDYDADGIANLTQEYIYDGRGNLIQQNVDYGDSEIPKTTTKYTYDEQNNLVREDIDYSADGKVEESITYTYDEQNNLVESLTFDPEETDYEIYERFDENGNRVEKREDEDADGTADYITFFTFDENGNRTRQDIDSDGDGSIDRIKNYVYDAQNNLIERTYDNDANGKIEASEDSSWTYINVYDENNNLIEQSFVEDGVVDNIETYVYDDRGNLIRLSLDEDADGDIDDETTFTYTEFDSTVAEEETLEEVEQPVEETGDPVEEVETPVGETPTPVVEEETSDEEVEQPVDETPDPIEEVETPVNEIIDPVEEVETPVEEISNPVELEDALELAAISTEVHRFYQYEKGFDFYTSDPNEVAYIKEQSESGLAYRYEDAEYMVLSDDLDPLTGETIEGVEEVYRFFNTSTGAHLYTMDETEKSYIIDNLSNYVFEGISHYAFESQPDSIDTIAVYRMLDEISGVHLFSTDTDEIDRMMEDAPQISMENDGEAVFYAMEI